MVALRNGASPLTLHIGKLLADAIGHGSSEFGRLLHSNDFHALVHLDGSYHLSGDAEGYLSTEVFSKFPFDIGIDRAAVALDTFHAVENSLLHSDKNLKALLSGSSSNPDFHYVFHTAKAKIRSALGPFNWSNCERGFGFGPGACVGITRRIAQVPNKFGKLKPTVTLQCLDLAVAAVCSNSAWRDFHASVVGQDQEQWFTIVAGNKVTTVPKNAKTDRTIAVEPQMNMYIQKGIGSAIRSRLLRVGVDLNDQTHNQRLALEGSLDGSLATIDLKSASDSVSWFLCQEILPSDWMSAIELSRSPRGVLPDGSSIYYRKVSSMGNGFTFELETLIFWAICSSVIDLMRLSDRRLGIYGDDLIVPTDAARLLTSVLSCLGFTVNAKKTHVDGLFRESCGLHAHGGRDVTPFYIRENIDSPDRLILLANQVRAYSRKRLGADYGCDKRFQTVWNAISNCIPARYRVYGPLFHDGQLNDSALGVNFDESHASVRRAKHQIDGYVYKRLLKVSRRRVLPGLGVLLAHLDQHGRDPYRPWCELSSILVESRPTRFMKRNGLVRLWYDIGPWL
jgi:hypothetical protein